MFQRSVLPLVLATALLAGGVLTGCSAGALPGGSPSGAAAAGASPAASDAPAAKCTASGTTIPAGTYSGDITSTLTTDMHLSLPGGVSVPFAGAGTEAMDGEVKIVSNGRTVTGAISLSGDGTSEVGGQVHSKSEGDFSGKISGPANSPIVTATMGGAWQTLDAPINGDGSGSSPTTVGLHITSVSCDAITGDAIAMFGEAAKPVEEYITVGGTGTWTAARH